MKRLIYIIFPFLAGCYAMQEHVKIKYKTDIYVKYDTCIFKSSTKEVIPVKVSMIIPDDYTFKGFTSNNTLEKQYWYHDGSVIYITDEPHSDITYKYIEETGKSSERYFLRDTMTLSGKDRNGRYWKDIKIYQFCIGYSNVTAQKKEVFDQTLKSLTVNKKSGLQQFVPR